MSDLIIIRRKNQGDKMKNYEQMKTKAIEELSKSEIRLMAEIKAVMDRIERLGNQSFEARVKHEKAIESRNKALEVIEKKTAKIEEFEEKYISTNNKITELSERLKQYDAQLGPIPQLEENSEAQ